MERMGSTLKSIDAHLTQSNIAPTTPQKHAPTQPWNEAFATARNPDATQQHNALDEVLHVRRSNTFVCLCSGRRSWTNLNETKKVNCSTTCWHTPHLCREAAVRRDDLDVVGDLIGITCCLASLCWRRFVVPFRGSREGLVIVVWFLAHIGRCHNKWYQCCERHPHMLHSQTKNHRNHKQPNIHYRHQPTHTRSPTHPTTNSYFNIL
jgi:hypothetical protein